MGFPKLTTEEATLRYQQLIFKRQRNPICDWTAGETEVHHIIPKCLMKDSPFINDRVNLIRLYAHEHLLAHYYLTIMYPSCFGLQVAFSMMINGNPQKQRARAIIKDENHYEEIKKEIARNIKDRPYNKRYGKHKAKEIKRKIRKAKLNKLIRFITPLKGNKSE